MTTKEYLNSIRTMDLKIKQRMRELDDLRSITPGMTGTAMGERVQSSRNYDSIGNYVAKVADISMEIEKEKAHFIDRKHRIIDQIQGLENPQYIDVLFRRYVLYQNFVQISSEMAYSYQWTIEMHGNALQAFERTYRNLY